MVASRRMVPMPDRLDRALIDGRAEPPSTHIDLCTGPLSMVFEPNTGFLRYIRIGDREILRGIYAAVRDHNWGTIGPDITDLSHDGVPERFPADVRRDLQGT